MKLLYIDTETTGLSPQQGHEIIQLAVILEEDRETVFTAEYRMCPSDKALSIMDKGAVETHGISIEEAQKYPKYDIVQKGFVKDLSKFIDKYDSSDKAYVCAYNAKFDVEFLSSWFEQCGDKYLGSFINWRVIDPLVIIRFREYCGWDYGLEDHKLVTVCERFGISLDHAHDALSDVKALQKLLHLFAKNFHMPSHELKQKGHYFPDFCSDCVSWFDQDVCDKCKFLTNKDDYFEPVYFREKE